jgi:hypothetical protein
MRRLRWVSTAVFALSVTPDALFAQVDSLATRLALELNVPAFRLDVRRDSALVRSYPVSVGQRIYPTPLGEFQVQRIVWNPWWQPPESEWAAEDTLTPPGPRNPMGKVKLFFDPMYYLHGTPSVSSIGTAASHGCVRMRNEDAMDLARFLQSETSAAIDSATLLELVSSWNRTERVDLPVPVPVSVIYRLIEVRDTMLYAHRDIYRQRTGNTPADALVALAEAGYDTTRIDNRALSSFLRRAQRATSVIPIDSLMRSDSISVRVGTSRMNGRVSGSRPFPYVLPQTPSKECV